MTISRDETKKLTANYDRPLGIDEEDLSYSWSDESNIYYSYQLETPVKLNLSAAYTLGSAAIISVDYERINYNGMKFRDAGDNYDYTDHNSEINDMFNATGILRLGTEVKLNQNFSLRGGYNMIGNPWKESYTFMDGSTSEILNNNDSFSSYSAGFGYRQQSFFIDFAYRMNHSNYTQKVHEIYYSNPSGGSATATLTQINHQATISFGFRF
jgi:hypothetical protein